MGQNVVWVGQARVWVGHGLPGPIARTASEPAIISDLQPQPSLTNISQVNNNRLFDAHEKLQKKNEC